jgi:hypothetical protein
MIKKTNDENDNCNENWWIFIFFWGKGGVIGIFPFLDGFY